MYIYLLRQVDILYVHQSKGRPTDNRYVHQKVDRQRAWVYQSKCQNYIQENVSMYNYIDTSLCTSI